jgi:hypothetical protein
MGRPEPGANAGTGSVDVDPLESILAHHGIKGMKWGVRRSRSSIDSAPASADTKTIDSHKETVKSGGTRALQTHELQALVNRMNLEKQYKDLLDKEPNSFKTGQKAVKQVLSVGKTLNEVHSFVNSPIGKALKKAAGL